MERARPPAHLLLQIPVVLAYRAENVYQLTIGDSFAAVPNVWWDNHKLTAIQLLYSAINIEFKNSLNYERALLMHMLMVRYWAPSLYINKVECIGIGMD